MTPASVRLGVLAVAVLWVFAVDAPGAHRLGTEIVAVALGGLALTVTYGWLRVAALHLPATMTAGLLVTVHLLGAGQGLPVALIVAPVVAASVAVAAVAPIAARAPLLAPVTTLLTTAIMWGIVRPSVAPSPIARPVLLGIDLAGERALYLLALLLLAAGWYAVDNLARADLGLRLRTLGADPALLQRSGGRPTATCLAGFGVSGALGGLAGVVLALHWRGLPDAELLAPAAAVVLLAVPVAGGSREPLGAVLGAVLLIGMSRIVGTVLPAGLVVTGAGLLVAFVALRLDGILGAAAAWRRA